MSKLLSTLAIATVTTVAFASPAFAGDKTHKMKHSKVETSTVVTPSALETSEARVIATRAEAESEVLGAVARGEFVAVEGPDGRVYYNRTIPVSELPDPELNLITVDTVTVEHNGQTFTNKIVDPVN